MNQPGVGPASQRSIFDHDIGAGAGINDAGVARAGEGEAIEVNGNVVRIDDDAVGASGLKPEIGREIVSAAGERFVGMT